MPVWYDKCVRKTGYTKKNKWKAVRSGRGRGRGMNMKKKDFKKLSKKEQFNLIWSLTHDDTRPTLRDNTLLKFQGSPFPEVETLGKQVYSEQDALKAYATIRALCQCDESISDVDTEIVTSKNAEYLIVVTFGGNLKDGIVVYFVPLGTTLKKTHPILFLKDSKMDLKVIYDEGDRFVAKNIYC